MANVLKPKYDINHDFKWAILPIKEVHLGGQIGLDL